MPAGALFVEACRWAWVPSRIYCVAGILFQLYLLTKRDVDDLIALAAAGRIDLDGIADLLADQRARDRRGDRHFAAFHIGLIFTDDLVSLLFFGVVVDERHRGAEHDRIAGKFRQIDALGP